MRNFRLRSRKLQIHSNHRYNMFLIPFFIFLIGCTNTPIPKKASVKADLRSKHKTITTKHPANPWTVNTYAPKPGESSGRKYVKFDADGDFSNSTISSDYLHAEIFVDKVNAGIFLHQSQRSNPSEKFSGPVRIKLTDSSGAELQLISSKGWNKSGGILIERNNNDYSQFRIFLLQADGVINVEIHDNDSSEYHFDINAYGFSEAFSQI
jgi:hypothetical protein